MNMKALVDAFVRRIKAEALPVEGIMAYRENRLAAEHRFTEDRPRNIYSHTKSYMATAAGMAIADGKLSLSDRVADFFPASLPKDPEPALLALTLRDLLMMASGFDRPLLMMGQENRGADGPDYLRFVLGQPLRQPPGEKFCYSNGDSYAAGRMVEAAVGMTLLEYLNVRLFAPLEMPKPEWEHCPLGHTFGASGMRLRLADMLKLGRLYQQGGMWNGQPLVTGEWIQMATLCQIGTPATDAEVWKVGYGYQFWVAPYPHAYRADGAYGQLTVVLPEAEAVVAIQSAESEMGGAIHLALHEEILSRL